jgi:hypothetical protein
MSEFLDKMVPFIVSEGIIPDILGSPYRFRIVKQEFEPRLPGFVGLLEGVLFISDSTPLEYSEYIFWHEVKCVVHCNRQGCAQTVKAELERVPKRILRAYTEYRCTCFEALMQFYSRNPPSFYHEIVTSYEYLSSLIEG